MEWTTEMHAVTFNAPKGAEENLTHYWSAYFREIPTCAHDDCHEVAREVDPYFPYIDDLNRCMKHIAQGAVEGQFILS